MSPIGTASAFRTAAIALLALSLAGVPVLRAQEPERPVLGDRVQRTGDPIVAVTWLFPAGSELDPAGREGAAWLLADAVARAAEQDLRGEGARVTSTVRPGRTIFQLLAPPESWEFDRDVVERVLYEAAVDPSSFEAARSALLAEISFDAGAPQREFEERSWAFLSGGARGWSHRARGYPETVRETSIAEAGSIRAELFRASEATVTVVGPGVARLSSAGDDAISTDRMTPPSRDSAAAASEAEFPAAFPQERSGADLSAPAPPAPGIERIEREVTSAWVGWAFPAAPQTDRTTLELLAHLLDERLDPELSPPGRFASRARIADTPHGAVLHVTLAVDPRNLGGWQSRVEREIERLRTTPLTDDVFFWLRRRYRSEVLFQVASPGGMGLQRALDLVHREDAPLEERVRRLTPAGVRAAAAALGPPRVFVLGPPTRE